MAGLKPIHPVKVRKYLVPASDATVMGIGDCVVKTGDSNDAVIKTGSGEYAIGALNECARASSGDGNKITGVITAVDINPDDYRGAPYRKASTATVVTVTDDPEALFSVACDGVLTVDSVGLNTNLVGSAGVNTATGEANVLADATAAADASNQLLIVAMDRTHGNALTDAAPKIIVKINQHTEVPGSSGALGIA